MLRFIDVIHVDDDSHGGTSFSIKLKKKSKCKNWGEGTKKNGGGKKEKQ